MKLLPRLRNLLVRLGLLVVGVVVAAGLGEMLARALEQPTGDLYEAEGWPAGPLDRYRLVDDDQGWEPVPNFGEPGGQFSFNGLGLRDFPAQREKPAGTRRIVVLGDSVTFGPGLDLDENYDNQLERMLTEKLGQPVEALNMAVPGYNSVQEALYFERRGLDLGADLVLVAWTTNDDEFTWAIVVSGDKVMRRLPQDPHLPVFLSLPPRMQVWLMRNSALYRLISRRGAVLAAGCAGEAELETLALATSQNRLALWRIAELARERGAGVLFVLWPEFSGDPEAAALLTETRAFLEESGLPLLDLRPAFAGRDGETLMRFPPHDIMHPSALASRLAAEATAAYIAEHGFDLRGTPTGSRRLPTGRSSTEAAEPRAPRYYVPAPDLGDDGQAFARMTERYPDAAGDAVNAGPDLAGFAAGRCGEDLCFRVRVARPLTKGDRLMINLVSGETFGRLTLRPLQAPEIYAAVGIGQGPETYLPVEPRGEGLVFEARVPRAQLPPPLDRVRRLRAGEVISFSVDDGEQVADTHWLMIEFTFPDAAPAADAAVEERTAPDGDADPGKEER